MKQQSFSQFLVRLTTLSTIALTGVLLLYSRSILLHNFSIGLIFGMFVFFYGTTALIHYVLIAGTKGKGPQSFIFYFLGATAVKIFLYMGVIVIYALMNRAGAKQFVLLFLLLYFLYTIFEVSSLFKMLLSEKKTN